MQLSVEISLYPLQDTYIEKIDAFLYQLNRGDENIEILTSNMSTRLFGEFEAVTNLLNRAMQHSMQEHGKMVFVVKYLSGDARTLPNYS